MKLRQNGENKSLCALVTFAGQALEWALDQKEPYTPSHKQGEAQDNFKEMGEGLKLFENTSKQTIHLEIVDQALKNSYLQVIEL